MAFIICGDIPTGQVSIDQSNDDPPFELYTQMRSVDHTIGPHDLYVRQEKGVVVTTIQDMDTIKSGGPRMESPMSKPWVYCCDHSQAAGLSIDL